LCDWWDARDAGGACDSHGCDSPSDCYRSFDIVVKGIAFVSEVCEQLERHFHLEIFSLNQNRLAEDFLNSLYELLNKFQMNLTTESRIVPAVIQ
jgi:hypothetical protein